VSLGPRALVAVLVTLVITAGRAPAGTTSVLDFAPEELRVIARHGPWPPPAIRDPTNRVSGHPAAIALGYRLFFDARVSRNGALACATCHVPVRGWTDGRRQAVGLAPVERNTPSVLNVGLQRWFAWDGRSDSLWSQSLKPILDPREMGADARHAAAVVAGDRQLSCLYAAAHGEPAVPGASDERVLVNVGKALAAFLETVGTGRTPFDDFRDALLRGDATAAARYPLAAQRGLRIFVGAGNCSVCHFGPAFTNGEFHDVGIPFMAGPGRVDAGRYEGIKRVRADRFNLLGPYSDAPASDAATRTRHVDLQQVNFGQFKTPSLRNVARTAPYMHDGRYATLADVVRHYAELDMERIHTHGEQLLRPLGLAPTERDDLIAFLESLTAPDAPSGPPPPPDVAGCPGSSAD
jgi:cytochrome c peroxidase